VNRKGTAYHEAGHVVAAYRFHHGIDSVTIRPDKEKGRLGAAVTEDAWSPDGTAEEMIVVLYAGRAAQLRFDPKAAGVDCDPRQFRIAVEKALYKEGMLVGQWQTMPVPAQDLFQSKLGYAGTGHPWAINEAKGIKYDYNIDQWPVANMLCDTYTVFHGVHAPNARDLMDKFIAAVAKVWDNLDAAIAHADDEGIYPGADGKLYGAG